MGRIARANARLRGTTDVFDKPAWKELLPPPLPPPHNRPYTLLISMEDLITASTWDVSVLIHLMGYVIIWANQRYLI